MEEKEIFDLLISIMIIYFICIV